MCLSDEPCLKLAGYVVSKWASYSNWKSIFFKCHKLAIFTPIYFSYSFAVFSASTNIDFSSTPTESVHFQDCCFTKAEMLWPNCWENGLKLRNLAKQKLPECRWCAPRCWGWESGAEQRTRYFSFRIVISESKLPYLGDFVPPPR